MGPRTIKAVKIDQQLLEVLSRLVHLNEDCRRTLFPPSSAGAGAGGGGGARPKYV